MFKPALILAALLLVAPVSFAEQSTSEKVDTTANDAKRSIKKGGNRVKEAVCAEGDAKCLGKKAKHRVQEGADYSKDKAKEAKDHVD